MVTDPRHDLAVVEAQPQRRADGDAAGDAFHDPHHVGGVPAGWHEIGDSNRPFRSDPLRLQYQRVGDVLAAGAGATGLRGDLPVPGLRRVPVSYTHLTL